MLYSLDERQCRNLEVSSNREWLLANGIGGYAMGSASGINTRRYHGHLVSATVPPATRMVMLSNVEAFLHLGGHPIGISTHQYPGAIYPDGHQLQIGFTSGRYATWTYRSGKSVIEKRLGIHPGVNACTLRYVNRSQRPAVLSLKPLVSHKPYHHNFAESPDYPDELAFDRHSLEVSHGGVRLWLGHGAAVRNPVEGWYYRFEHMRELERGLPPRDDLFCPCELHYELLPGQSAVLVASTDGPQPELAMDDEYEPGPFDAGEALAQASKLFLVHSPTRTSVLAGYPWFTDWGRDTMVALPGLCLSTGQYETARQILRDYGDQMRDGLIPNRFEDEGGIDYHTADGTLWFAYAIGRTLAAEWDAGFAEEMLPRLEEIRRTHVDGTRFGIKVDPEDGLLCQGGEGLQMTWMDAKIGEWVVTPRTGKAIEICGLWIQAMRAGQEIAERLGQSGEAFAEAADRALASFGPAFWDEDAGYFRDVVGDSSLRPNQVIALSLPAVQVPRPHAESALRMVAKELLTPKGLRTLAPSDPRYRGRFSGPMADLDSAYHQGTVWPWLLGPYVTAYLRYGGSKQEARKLFRELKHSIQEYGLGGIAEVYDGDPPQHGAGCPWQAWSVAELLRAWTEDLGGPVRQDSQLP